MVDKRRRYSSYTDQKKQHHRVRWIVLGFLVFFIFYNILTSLFFFVRVLENETMQPGFHRGDRFIFSSFRIHSLLPDSGAADFLRRGNIVLVDKSMDKKQGFFPFILDRLIRFFTAQRISLHNDGENLFIKRVIGLPGDEVSMVNFVIRVKPKEDPYSYTEFELWDRPYETKIPSIPALWDESLPFSRNMEKIVLGDDECFVLSDDRSNTNDSRTWGPLPCSLIAGKAVFRLWPLTQLGLP